jgi:predicted HNH restriction endonuclease
MDFSKHNTNRLELIESTEDLIKNLKGIELLLDKHDKYIRDIIARGTSYVFYKFDGKDRFIPSRFIGYKNITPDKHKNAINKQGGATNYAISKILKLECCVSKRKEEQLHVFFENLFGSTSEIHNKEHKFWETDISLFPTLEQQEDKLYQEVVLLNKNRTYADVDLRNYGKIEKKTIKPTRLISYFIRDPQVVADALLLANGVCQGCGAECLEYGKETKVFKRSDDSIFLEVHHIKPLSEGGLDMLENACALCPTCHRLLHHGQERDKKKIIERIKKTREEKLKEHTNVLQQKTSSN